METSSESKNEVEKKFGKRLSLIIRVLVFLGAVALIYVNSERLISLYNHYFVNDHEELVTYLDQVERYNDDSDSIVKNVKLKLFRLSSEEYSSEIQKTKDQLQQLIDEAMKLKAPNGFENHKKSVLALLDQRMVVLVELDEARKVNLFDKLNASLNDLKQKQEFERASLEQAFMDSGIEYKELGDGSFRFWYKEHSGKEFKE
ncbi:hypothetical protein [Neobacillus sp. LXY-4]|uniref:hypothetical protein n=1 Tax=Neobacillus sp. LXY-4 TaxID=3379826 RepID=UPI003EE39668